MRKKINLLLRSKACNHGVLSLGVPVKNFQNKGLCLQEVKAGYCDYCTTGDVVKGHTLKASVTECVFSQTLYYSTLKSMNTVLNLKNFVHKKKKNICSPPTHFRQEV